MVELVKVLGEREAVIIGHDWGAPVARLECADFVIYDRSDQINNNNSEFSNDLSATLEVCFP
jgi:hypothetical protein